MLLIISQSPLGVKNGPSSLLTDESVDRPRTDENIEKADIGVLMSANGTTQNSDVKCNVTQSRR